MTSILLGPLTSSPRGNAGRLQYRVGSMHGNPWLRLPRSELEELVRSKHGERGLEDRKVSAELAHVDREMKRL